MLDTSDTIDVMWARTYLSQYFCTEVPEEGDCHGRILEAALFKVKRVILCKECIRLTTALQASLPALN